MSIFFNYLFIIGDLIKQSNLDIIFLIFISKFLYFVKNLALIAINLHQALFVLFLLFFSSNLILTLLLRFLIIIFVKYFLINTFLLGAFAY